MDGPTDAAELCLLEEQAAEYDAPQSASAKADELRLDADGCAQAVGEEAARLFEQLTGIAMADARQWMRALCESDAPAAARLVLLAQEASAGRSGKCAFRLEDDAAVVVRAEPGAEGGVSLFWEPTPLIENEAGRKQRFKELLFEASGDALFVVCSESLKILDCNRTAVTMLGFTEKSQIIGRIGSEFHADDTQVDSEALTEKLNQGQTAKLEILYRRADGGEFWGAFSVWHLEMEGRSYQLVRLTDISERIAQEELTRQKQRQLQAVLDSAPDQIEIKDAEGRFVLVNRALASFYGKEPSDFPGKTPEDLGIALPATVAENEAKVLADGAARVFVYELEKDGRPCYLQANRAPYYCEPRRLEGIVGVTRDVTAQQLQDQVFKVNTRLIRETQEMARIGSWEYFPESGEFYGTATYYDVHDVPREEPLELDEIVSRIPAEDRSKILEALNLAITQRKPYELTHRLRARNGANVRHIQVRARPVAQDGEVRKVVGASMDVTEVKENEFQFRRATARFSAIFRNAPYAIIVKDANGIIQQSNPAARALLGRSEAELKERHFSGFVHPEDLGHNLELFFEVVEGKRETYDIEKRVRNKKGHYVWVRQSSAAVKDRTGKARRVISMMADIQIQKQIEEALQLAIEEAERAYQTKTQLVAQVSHDLKNPMSGIAGALKLLDQTILAPKQREYLDLIKLSQEKMHLNVANLLDYSQLEASAMQLEISAFDCERFVRRHSRLYRFLAEEKGLAFELKLPEELPAKRLRGDSRKLARLLDNLVSNAIKYTEKGKITLEIAQGKDDNGWITRFAVRDTGAGISEDQMAKLFRAYSRLDSDATRKAEGAGLGLSIARSFAQLMGGDVQVKSQVGKGSEFFCDLPLEAAPEIRQRARKKPPRDQEPAPLRLLLAEDDEVVSEYLSALLRGQGWRVSAAFNGRQALARLKKETFDLALVDGDMPVMDGFAFLREIREESSEYARPELPVVAVSGYATAEEQARFKEAGANYCVNKPIDEEELFTVIRELTSGNAAAY